MKKYSPKVTAILWIVIIALVLAAALLLYNVLKNEYVPETSSEEEITDPYIDFTVYDTDGNEIKLSDVVSEGKPIVINFWTTWCTYCIQEMPEFNEVYSEYGDNVNFIMLDVNGGGNDNMEDALAYVEKNNFGFPIYFDTVLSATSAYGVTGFPTTVIIDKIGNIVYHRSGAMSKDNLISILEQIL